MLYDVHADQEAGFFDGPVDNLFAMNYFVRNVLARGYSLADLKARFVVASPDAGGVKRAEKFANFLGGLDVAIIHKNRPNPGEVGTMKLVGSVQGYIVLMIDDIADTCGTLVKAAQVLKENGAIRTIAFATHGVLSGAAFQNLQGAKSINFELFVTDTIDVQANAESKKMQLPSNLTVLSVAEMTAVAIQTANQSGSLSQLYDYDTWLKLFTNFQQ